MTTYDPPGRGRILRYARWLPAACSGGSGDRPPDCDSYVFRDYPRGSGAVGVLTLFGPVTGEALPEGIHLINPLKTNHEFFHTHTGDQGNGQRAFE